MITNVKLAAVIAIRIIAMGVKANFMGGSIVGANEIDGAIDKLGSLVSVGFTVGCQLIGLFEGWGDFDGL
jgi:hypothetical protein